MKTKQSIKKPVIIAVEGLSYYYTLIHQIKDVPHLQHVQIWNFADGLDLHTSVGLLVDEGGFRRGEVRSFGIIRDVEDDRNNTEKSVQSVFRNNSLPVPARQLEVAPGSPNVGYLIIPFDRNSGCLEHACLDACLLPSERMQCVESFYNCVSEFHEVPFNENKRAKVKVHALIASHIKPEMTLSESTLPGVDLWDFNHASLKVMIDFIEMVKKA